MAYAAVTSLMETLSLHFLQSQSLLPLEDKQKIAPLHENLGFLQQILEKSEIANDDVAMKDLEKQMRDVSFKAEERIELELSIIYKAKGWTKRLRIWACLLRLDGIFNEAVKQTDYLKKKFIKITSEHQLAKASAQKERITNVSFLGSTSSQSNLEWETNAGSKFSKISSKFDSRMVGCEEEFMKILDQLTLQSAKQRQVVSIVGMGGIGKTTLAQKVYEDPSITSYFDKQAWVTVTHEYNVGQMLRCLIGCVIAAAPSDELDEQSNVLLAQRNDLDQLAENLYKCLKGQRYLIVMDDIWSTTAWDSVQRCFPDDNNGSRILLTSRLKEVVEYASSCNSPLNMRFLDVDESWNLYCKVFGKIEFLCLFEEIGRDIVKKCRGLPLAIIVVASLLSRTEEKVEKWKNVTENVTRLVNGDSNEVCSRILSLSYNQLPHNLKACFLYFGVFPEDYEIPVKKLVKLWAAEGFLGAVKHQNLEEVAMECLKDLVDRSLVIVSRQSYNGKMKTIRIHDLLRDLCLREARHENLLNVIGNDYHDVVGLEKLPFYKRKSQHSFSKPCRWTSIRPGCFTVDCFDKFHSLHCVNFFSAGVFSHFKLLRVVDMELTLPVYGDIVLNLVHLRYLGLSIRRNFGSLKLKLFELPNLQSLIVRGFGKLDSSHAIEIWKMPQLRNFYADQICSLETLEGVHRKLETISWLGQACCTKDLFTRIPNFKKLGIDGRFSSANPDCFNNFVDLGQLEKLSIRDWHLKRIPCSSSLWATSFLPKLKKLSFIRTSLPWSDVRLIGMLPNLEVLKLIHALIGQEWEPSEGGFRRLKRLVIRNTHLKYWNAGGDHFPVLECLEISKCYSLEEIPSGFADITTLALIRLNYCWDSLLASAKWIQDEQLIIYGNNSFLVHSENIRVFVQEQSIF